MIPNSYPRCLDLAASISQRAGGVLRRACSLKLLHHAFRQLFSCDR